jgi:hypothetical protein
VDMELKSKIWFGACTICWAIWLCRNEVIFYNALVPTPMQVIFRGTYWMRQWALLIKEDPRAQVKLGCRQLEMAMGTRNPNTRRVLPDMKAGTG